MSDPILSMVDEATTTSDIVEAAMVVRSTITSGGAEPERHHAYLVALLAKGYRVIADGTHTSGVPARLVSDAILMAVAAEPRRMRDNGGQRVYAPGGPRWPEH